MLLRRVLSAWFARRETRCMEAAKAAARDGSWPLAAEHARRAVQIQPQNGGARRLLGAALIEMARLEYARAVRAGAAPDVRALYDEAIVHLEEAQRLDPATAFEACMGRGIALRERGDLQGARQAFSTAVQMRPDSAEAGCELALALQSLGETQGAITAYREVIARHPEHAIAHAGLGLSLLGSGDFAAGWDEYEWRLRSPDAASARRFPFPYWAGESLAGRTLLVRSEQGVGDEVMFASCLPQIIEAGAHCVIECSRRLAGLYRRSFPRATVLERNLAAPPDWTSLPRIDVQAMAGSLPRFLRRRREDFPGSSYLLADPARVADWRSRVRGGSARRVIGLAWTGGLPGTLREVRSLDLSQLGPVLGTPGARFVSLERLDHEAALAQWRRQGVDILSWPGLGTDLDELAAAVSALDLVITVPTAVAHFAGALGIPAWVLVPHVATWRYLWSGERMPWYSALRMLRPSAQASLDQFLSQTGRELASFVSPTGA